MENKIYFNNEFIKERKKLMFKYSDQINIEYILDENIEQYEYELKMLTNKHLKKTN